MLNKPGMIKLCSFVSFAGGAALMAAYNYCLIGFVREKKSDFFIPALSVQPIVENAVKHGMMGKDETCTIAISARETDLHYE